MEDPYSKSLKGGFPWGSPDGVVVKTPAIFLLFCLAIDCEIWQTSFTIVIK